MQKRRKEEGGISIILFVALQEALKNIPPKKVQKLVKTLNVHRNNLQPWLTMDGRHLKNHTSILNYY